MKTKYLWRNLFREIARTLTRFLSIFAISAIGVSFFTGVRASGPDMKLTADAYLDRTQLADITALSTAGLSEDDMDAIRAIPGVAMAEPALATDAMMRAAVREEYPDTTVILVAQRVSSVKSAHQILVLEEGAVAGLGTHEALMRDCAVYRQIAQIQMGGNDDAAA